MRRDTRISICKTITMPTLLHMGQSQVLNKHRESYISMLSVKVQMSSPVVTDPEDHMLQIYLHCPLSMSTSSQLSIYRASVPLLTLSAHLFWGLSKGLLVVSQIAKACQLTVCHACDMASPLELSAFVMLDQVWLFQLYFSISMSSLHNIFLDKPADFLYDFIFK